MTVINSRRFFMMASIFSVLEPGLVFASQQNAAIEIVDQAVSKINQIINSGDTQTQMLRSFERVFNVYADVPTIAKYALGRDARTASEDQLKAYKSFFRLLFQQVRKTIQRIHWR